MTDATVEAGPGPGWVEPSWAEAEPGPELLATLEGLGPGMRPEELLAGVRAVRRLTAACHGLERRFYYELFRRREVEDKEAGREGSDCGKYVADELSIEIGITVRAAERQLGRAVALAALPRTFGALRSGKISEWHADVIADWAWDPELPEGVAEVIEEAMLAAVGSMHTGKLRRLGEQLLKDLAPGVYEDRRKESIKDRRVEVKDDPDGTATLKACQVNKAIAHRVYDQLRADAQQLQRLGDDRNLGAIMADLMLRRALGEIDDPQGNNGPDNSDGPDGKDGGGGEPDGDGPADDSDGGVAAEGEPVPWPEAPMPDDPQPDDAGAEPDAEAEAEAEASGWLAMATLTRRRVRLGDADPLPDVRPGDEGRCGRTEACDRCGPPADRTDHGHLQVRLIHHAGTGLEELRTDAAHLLRQGVCVTIVNLDGETIQHGSGHYVPSPGLRRIIQQRHAYCGFPGCLRRAHKCDLDHSRAWPDGPTCPCELTPRHWYRTGDRVRREGGHLIHLGRIDQQVKVMGHRVEIGEVEAVMRRHPHVIEAAVVAVRADGGTKLLAAYSGAETGESDFDHWLRGQLPLHMVPSRIRRLDGLPLNENGKIDRSRLEELLG